MKKKYKERKIWRDQTISQWWEMLPVWGPSLSSNAGISSPVSRFRGYSHIWLQGQSKGSLLKAESVIRFEFHKKWMIFELDSQWNYTHPFRSPEAPFLLIGIVYGSVQATMYVSQLESQDSVPLVLLSTNTEWTARRPWRTIHWIWQKVYGIRVMDSTFKVHMSGGQTSQLVQSCFLFLRENNVFGISFDCVRHQSCYCHENVLSFTVRLMLLLLLLLLLLL